LHNATAKTRPELGKPKKKDPIDKKKKNKKLPIHSQISTPKERREVPEVLIRGKGGGRRVFLEISGGSGRGGEKLEKRSSPKEKGGSF